MIYVITQESYNNIWASIIAKLRIDRSELGSIITSGVTTEDREELLKGVIQAGVTMPYLVKLLAGYTDELPGFMDLSKLLTTCFDISSVVIMGLPSEFVFGELSKREVVKLAFEKIPSAVWMYYMANFDDRVTKMMKEMRNGTAEHA